MLTFLFSTKGRVKRVPYVVFALTPTLILWITGEILSGLVPGLHIPAYSLPLISLDIVRLLLVWPIYVLSVKRLHDLNRPGFPALIILSSFVMDVLYLMVPLIVPAIDLEIGIVSNLYETAASLLSMLGSIFFFARLAFIATLCFVPGTKGPNRFDSAQPDDSVFE
ncbi:DUF805 domain-containing protein [Asticcacaulis sp. BYS171W]|uniref:DUF805 domain-containing protein n=1 Tax=Asticcacaulis aquaticus TaxID=2984212 RepID=A0ABT5HW11_9CAUL|nr:DUF805 domain-containing protein [Asticcacaulis aquaticus]MDC7684266.1 DUF805 domain-containing protein [Asticcacaulis aquaticus]